MQRAQKRFVCSAASLSSPSITSLTFRRRTRTSSAGGDTLAVNRENEYNALLPDVKPKLQALKYNMNLPCQKNFKKPNRKRKLPQSHFHNAIVIAPFHTLKKSFQSKLVNMYCIEKININKLKMPKRRSMSFEYDVLELNKVQSRGKKGKKKAKKQKQNSNYCQCSRELKEKPKVEESDVSSLCRNGRKRRLDTPQLNLTLKTEIPPQFQESDMSLPHSGDSWGCLSDSRYNEEGEEGRIDSYKRESVAYVNNAKNKRRRISRKKRTDTEYVGRPMSDSRDLIMNDESKSSDGHIADFLDREPQTRNMSVELKQHLKPLRRQRKSKIGKPPTNGVDYYLRSKSPSREKLFPDKWEGILEKRTVKGRRRSVQVEAATQVEDGTSEEKRQENEPGAEDPPTETDSVPMVTETNDVGNLPEQTIVEDSNETIQIDMGPSIEADVILPSKEGSGPQESDFIFGPRSTASRLGESCEFTFGLNWILSDDEISEHGNCFY